MEKTKTKASKTIKNLIFLTLFFIVSIGSNAWALTQSQAQDIRFSKAKAFLIQDEKEKALKLFKDILNGPFHYEASTFLARYFYEERNYPKSFRLYQHILKTIYDPRVVRFNFTPSLRAPFRELVQKKSNPDKRALSTAFEVAEKYFEAYTFNYFPGEYNKSILNLSEKYFQLVDTHSYRNAITKFYLSKIFLLRKDYNLAIKTLQKTEKAFKENKIESLELGLKEEDIKVTLAEAYAKAGFNDSSTLVLLNLQKRKDLSSSNRHYVSTFLKQLEKTFLKSTFSYQLKSKGNINQLGEEDYENFENLNNRQELGEKDSLVHWGRYHLYYHRRIASDQDIGVNGSFLFEKPLDSSVKKPENNQYDINIHYQYHAKDNRFWSLNYHLYRLDGRKLDTLINFQAESKHEFSLSHIWINPTSRWILSFPLEFRKTQTNRSANSLGVFLEYQPYLKTSWLNPTLHGQMARRSEGEPFGSSFIFQLGLENLYPITDKINWSLAADYYLNSNSDVLLNYSEMILTNLFTYPLNKKKNLLLEADLQYRSRTNDIVGNINTFDMGLGLTYAF